MRHLPRLIRIGMQSKPHALWEDEEDMGEKPHAIYEPEDWFEDVNID
jgi:hypothetical protein